jgi:AraC-like DNA-binding protein
VIQVIPVLFLLGAAQGAFLALALLTGRGGNRRANRWLGLYLLVFVAALIDYFLDTTGLVAQLPWIRSLLWPKEFLYGTLIYLYCREVTRPGEPPGLALRLFLWLPPFLHVCLAWPLLWLPPTIQFSILLNEPGLDGFHDLWRLLLGDVELILTFLHLSICLGLCLGLLRRHRQRALQAFSYTRQVSLNWLRNLLLGTFVVYLLWLIEEVFSDDLLAAAEWEDVLLGASMVALIYALAWMGLRQPRIFAAPIESPTPAAAPEADPAASGMHSASPAHAPGDAGRMVAAGKAAVVEATAKYARSALSEELAAGLMTELRELMQREHLYLESDLSLATLAARLGVSTNYLSQAINQRAGQNFFDFVNGHRVAYTLPLLADSSDTVLSIALAAGFNSKSAFYSAFRRHQAMTPGQYRARLQGSR